MTTTIHQILFTRKHNENATTAMDAYAPWSGQVDLNETGTFCASFDWDMLVTAKLYEVRDVELPSWLPAAEWCNATIDWKYTWGAGVDRAWSEAWQRGLKSLSFADRYAACKLLNTKKFRSEFRKSLRDQIVAWLETPAADRRYGNPLSPRQWAAISGPAYETKRAQEQIYRDR
jgi:hypothetical protein